MPFDALQKTIWVGRRKGVRLLEGCDGGINIVGEYICSHPIDTSLGGLIVSLEAFLEARKDKHRAMGEIGID